MNSEIKLNQLLQNIPNGVVLLSSWLREKGYSHALQQRYRKSGWLESIGYGAMIRQGQKLQLFGAIHTLQSQAGLQVHIGGRTAIGLQGLAHYLELDRKFTYLFAPNGVELPAWIRNNQWDTQAVLTNSSLLPPEIGLVEYSDQGFNVNISGGARSFMECLLMAPEKFDLMEAKEIMEGLNLLHPNKIQLLLEQCKSIKVKRLFLFLAEQADHAWFKYLKIEKLDLGKGKRSLGAGVYIPKYKITVPENIL